MMSEAWPTGDVPAFMLWEPPELSDTAFTWHRDECAMCGVTRDDVGAMHLDHDHDSGLARGYLCLNCNIHEPNRLVPAFEAWRSGMNPCAMFGWDYRRQDSRYTFAVTDAQRVWLVHKSVLAPGAWGHFHEPGVNPFR